jgi:hypothetical protein
MSSSDSDTATCLGLDPEYLNFRQSISSLAKWSAIIVSSNIKLNNFEVLKSSDGYELWSQKMSLILEVIGLYDIVVMGIDLSVLKSALELIIFQAAEQYGLLFIIQIVSIQIFGEIAILKPLYGM